MMLRLDALQLHYTSCRASQQGGRGFQTRSKSDGIRPDEQREIEALSGYSPPRDLPSQPTHEDIGSDFPIGFRVYRLSSGRLAVTCARYVGQDFSGRWGNFFSHTLVLDETQWRSWPVDLFEWDGWKPRLEPGEDTDEKPGPLPEIHVECGPFPAFSPQELQTFLNEVPGRGELLRAMIRATFFGPEHSRMVLIRDSALNGIFWLACIQKAFPRRHAANLSMSAYQYDTRNCAVLNATTSGTDLTLDSTQRDFQFCAFDCLTGSFSAIPDDYDSYARMLARWMTEEPGVLMAFHAFMEEVEHDKVGPGLVSGLKLFQMQRGETTGESGPDLLAAIAFGAQYWTGSKVSLFPAALRAAHWAAEQGTMDDLKLVVQFLLDCVGDSAGTAVHGQLAQAWLQWVSISRQRDRWSNIEVLADIRSLMGTCVPNVECEIAAALLAGDNPSVLGAALGDLGDGTPNKIAAIVGEMTRALVSSQEAPAYADPRFHAFAVAAAPRIGHSPVLVASFLSPFRSDPQALGAMLSCIFSAQTAGGKPRASPASAEVLGSALVDLTRSEPVDAIAEIWRVLDRPETATILVEEWRTRMGELAPNDPGAYERYVAALAVAAPDITQRARGQLAQIFARALAATSRAHKALEWLKSGEVERFDEESKRWCITAAAAGICPARDSDAGAEAAHLVERYAHASGLTLSPDNPALRVCLEAMRDSATPTDTLDFSCLGRALQKIEANTYVTFLADFFRAAHLRLPKGRHTEMLTAVFVADNEAVFVDTYIRVLRSSLPAACTAAAVVYWIGEGFTARNRAVAALRSGAREVLTDKLARLSGKERDEVRQLLPSRGALGEAERARLKSIEEEVERRAASVLGRIGGFFRRT